MATELVELQEIGLDPTQVYERAKVDFSFFASLAIPSIYTFVFPNFYITIWNILTNVEGLSTEDLVRFALGLPRGHAKTTFVKVLIAWLICYDRVTFVLIVCANDDLAEQLLADINDILGSPNIEAIYGAWSSNISTDRGDLKKAIYHNKPVIIAGKGAGTSLRGLNIKNERPDLIFCDDVQTRENDESPTERARLMRWMVATLFKVIAPRGPRLIIYLGNMYSEECILRQFQKTPAWISLITGAILHTGQPLWPELHSLDSLMESYFHDESLGLGALWFAEIMNDPLNPATALLHDELPTIEFDAESSDFDASFLTIDPAGFKDVSDDNVIAVHKVAEGKAIIVDGSVGIMDPEELIIEALKFCILHQVSLIAVEDVGYQQTLQFWLNKYLEEWHMTAIHVVPLNPHGRTKEARIRQFILDCYAGNYYLIGEMRAAFVWQAMKYKIGAKKNKDDLLDACAYGLDVRNEYWQLLQKIHHNKLNSNPAYVVSNNTPF